MDLLMEAKINPGKPLTVISKDIFREIVRFEEWLMRLEYPLPAIHPNAPRKIRWYDICQKENVYIRAWPEDTPEDCRLVPRLCPEYAFLAPTIKACKHDNSPLDFIYDQSVADYNFRKYSDDNKLIAKVQTGKGDEKHWKYDGIGEVLYTEIMFGSTQPSVVQQDYFFGDNDITSARALRYRIRMSGLPKA